MKLKSGTPGRPYIPSANSADEIGKENVPLCTPYAIAADNELHMVSHRSETVVMQTFWYNIECVVTSALSTPFKYEIFTQNVQGSLIELSRSDSVSNDFI